MSREHLDRLERAALAFAADCGLQMITAAAVAANAAFEFVAPSPRARQLPEAPTDGPKWLLDLLDAAEIALWRSVGVDHQTSAPKWIPCVVDDCPESFGSIASLNTHSYWEHLQPNPLRHSDDPRVTYKRYPGADDAGDFKWFSIQITAPQTSTPPSTSDGEGPSERIATFASHPSGGHPACGDNGGSEPWVHPDEDCICELTPGHDDWHRCWCLAVWINGGLHPHPDSPTAVQPQPAVGPSWVDWVTPAICDVLAGHHPWERTLSGHVYVYCVGDDGTICRRFDDRQDYRDHVSDLIAHRIESASKPQK